MICVWLLFQAAVEDDRAHVHEYVVNVFRCSVSIFVSVSISLFVFSLLWSVLVCFVCFVVSLSQE